MEVTREVLAEQLRQELKRGVRGRDLARWAHGIYLSRSILPPEVVKALMTLIAVDEGPEFALADEDLWAMVDDLNRPMPPR